MPNLTRLLVVAAFAFCPPARAAVVAVYNSTDKPLTFVVAHPNKAGKSYTLAAGESRLVTVGRWPDIAFTAGGKAGRFRLEPYHAYMFSPGKGGAEFHGIDLAGAMPPPEDVAIDPVAGQPARLEVALFADDANPRSREAWERVYRGRLAAASAVLEKQCGVTLAVVSVGDWQSDPSHGDLFHQAKLFERTNVPAGVLAVGFIGRHQKANGDAADQPTGFARGPLWPYLLVRDGTLRTEPERVEAVVREVAHFLGAAHTPDPLSAMRGRPGDGRGYVGKYPIGLDPLNLLAVGIWVEELRDGSPKSVADLRPVSRDRLAVIYKTLSGLLPADDLAAEHLAAIERVGGGGGPARAEEMPKPAAPPVEVPIQPAAPRALDRTEAVRQVVTAVRVRAADLKRDPAADRAKGDALTVELLMAAGEMASNLDGPMRAPAFLIGIGIALDDSTVLRNNVLVGRLVKAAETDAERAERVAAVGGATLRGRRDLLQHFVVSAALAELIGPAQAEMIGKLKELADRGGGSGFSFADLAADLAGIELAKALTKYPDAIGRFRDGVDLNDYMPAIDGLKEGLTAAKFKELYGESDDPRYEAEVAAVRKRVTDLPKYKEIAELKVK